jgi:hypothetical protein
MRNWVLIAAAAIVTPPGIALELVAYGVAAPAVRALVFGVTCGARLPPPPSPYQASLPGVFAVGDVRSGSVRCVASAVGEGAVVVRSVHRHLAAQTAASTAH